MKLLFSRKTILLILAVIILCVSLVYMLLGRENPARIVEQCADAGNKPLCYTERIDEIQKTRGLSAAFDALAVAYDSDPEYASTCHSSTHELGKVAYANFERTGEVELSGKTSYCGYGFYHGFMETLFLDTNDLDGARDFCTYIGQNVPHPPPAHFAEGSCYHGIGHGVTDGTDPRLWGNPIALVKPGLVLCEKVASGNEEWHSRCVSGVFNALGNMYPDPKYKLDPGTNPYTLCRTGPFTQLEKETCYSQMNTQAAVLGNNKLEAIVAFGNTIQNLKYRRVAIHEAVSYYIQVLKLQQKSLSPEETRVCELATSELRDGCVSGLVGGIFEFGLPEQQYTEALNLCSAHALPQILRHSCFSALQINSKYYYTPDIFRHICTSIPPEYQDDLCRV